MVPSNPSSQIPNTPDAESRRTQHVDRPSSSPGLVAAALLLVLALWVPVAAAGTVTYTWNGSNEGFAKENSQTYSEVTWDSTNGRVSVTSDRRDGSDERFSKSLAYEQTSTTTFKVTSRWRATTPGNWVGAFPLYLAKTGAGNDLYSNANVIALRYDQRDDASNAPHYQLLYRDAGGVLRINKDYAGQEGLEYHFYVRYDSGTRVLEMKLLNANDQTLTSATYTVGTNSNDAFTVNKVGIGADGRGQGYEPPVVGWVDNAIVCTSPTGIYSFDCGNEGFAKENSQTYSEVTWDGTNGRVSVKSDRRDGSDERYTEALPSAYTSSKGFTVTSRWRATQAGNWNGAFPLFLAASASGNDLYGNSNVIAFRYDQRDDASNAPHYQLLYRDASGVQRIDADYTAAENTEYRFYVNYNAGTKVLTLKIRSSANQDLKVATYQVNTNSGDGFTLNKVGVGADGRGESAGTPVIGWVEDISVQTGATCSQWFCDEFTDNSFDTYSWARGRYYGSPPSNDWTTTGSGSVTETGGATKMTGSTSTTVLFGLKSVKVTNRLVTFKAKQDGGGGEVNFGVAFAATSSLTGATQAGATIKFGQELTTSYQTFKVYLSGGSIGLYKNNAMVGRAFLTDVKWIYFTAGEENRILYVDNLIVETDPCASSTTDNDGDGLNACRETAQGTSDASGTANRDKDKDGITDQEESQWYGSGQGVFCGTSCEYPRPTIPDLYVEVDWMNPAPGSNDPHSMPDSVANRIVDRFKGHNVRAHLDRGSLGGGSAVTYDESLTRNERYTYYNNNFLTAHKGIYRHALMAHFSSDGESVCGLGYTPGDNFTLFEETWDDPFNGCSVNNYDDSYVSLFLHELGHNIFGTITPADQYQQGDLGCTEPGPDPKHDEYNTYVMWPCVNGATDYHTTRWTEMSNEGVGQGIP